MIAYETSSSYPKLQKGLFAVGFLASMLAGSMLPVGASSLLRGSINTELTVSRPATLPYEKTPAEAGRFARVKAVQGRFARARTNSQDFADRRRAELDGE